MKYLAYAIPASIIVGWYLMKLHDLWTHAFDAITRAMP
jgi:hypothetical protein